MSFWTYMLRLNNGLYYTGHTEDLDVRIAQHQSGALKGYTYDKRPLELVWAEYFQTRDDAKAAELRVKGWSRAKKEALIAGDWDKLSRAAIPPHERAQRASAALGEVSRLRSTKTEKENEGGDQVIADPPKSVLSSAVETPSEENS